MIPKNTISTNRSLSIPLEYMISEFIAYPLTSKTAFEVCITKLDPEMRKETFCLWRGAEKQILHSVPDLTLDQAVSMRDRYWFFRPGGREIPLHEFLRQTARKFFEIQGASAFPLGFILEQNSDAVHSRNQAMRWLSFSLPPDLLLGALGDDGIDPPSEILHECPIFYRHLADHGFSENHLHAGAALEFQEYWVAVLHALAFDIDEKNDFFSPGAEFDEGEMLASWLLRAAIGRYLTALFLHEIVFSPALQENGFSVWLSEILMPRMIEKISISKTELLKIALRELCRGAFSLDRPNFKSLRSVYRRISGMAMRFPDDPRDIHKTDPISRLVPKRFCEESTPEICFIHRGISYMEKHPGDDLFSTVFWQAVRLRGIFYRHIVQRPMTPGLQWFVRMYARIKPGTKNVGFKLRVKSAAKTCGAEHGLQSLELRTAPDPISSDNLKKAKDAINVMEGISPEVGLVFHFPRIRGGGSSEGGPKAFWSGTEADPRSSMGSSRFALSRCRYSGYYRKTRKMAMGLARVIFNYPRSLNMIRGVDLCTDELGIPSWVLVPHLRYLRDAGRAASRHLKYCAGEKLPELRVSVHAGEDFVHLLGGLRRVDEAVKYFKLQTGDRIGHGLALGLNPEAWAKRYGRVSMYTEDRMFDLVWEWMKYSRNRASFPTDRLAFVETEIKRLTMRIFGYPIDPYRVDELVRDLHDEETLRQSGYPDYRPDAYRRLDEEMLRKPGYSDYRPAANRHIHDKREGMCQCMPGRGELLCQYLTDHRTFESGHEIEWVDVVNDIEPMKNLQNHVRQKLATVGIVVEVNPTSNLLIGNLTDLKNHPLWRLNPPTGTGDSPPVSVCIGSDDPITFATNLRQEYALLRENLIQGGLSNSEAFDYLDRIRLMGLNSRFTLKKDRIRHDKKSPSPPCDYHAFGIDKTVPLMP